MAKRIAVRPIEWFLASSNHRIIDYSDSLTNACSRWRQNCILLPVKGWIAEAKRRECIYRNTNLSKHSFGKETRIWDPVNVNHRRCSLCSMREQNEIGGVKKKKEKGRGIINAQPSHVQRKHVLQISSTKYWCRGCSSRFSRNGQHRIVFIYFLFGRKNEPQRTKHPRSTIFCGYLVLRLFDDVFMLELPAATT